MSAEETDRNPSPPPEILSNDELLPDRIGNSVYSKKWLYKTLMSIVELCEESTEPGKNKLCSKTNSVPTDTTDDAEIKSPHKTLENVEEAEMIELDPQIEEDACTLWDMSANKEVAQFLIDSRVLGIFLDVIDKTKSPRLLEIVLGILGNMSSFDFICTDISENKTLLCSVILLSGTSDTPSLLQVIRIILCGVSNENSQKRWFEVFEENTFFMENLQFICENSLNSAVIKNSFQLLQSILNESEKFCIMWGLPSRTKAIVVAGKQLLKLHDCLDSFFCLLNSLCEHEPNVEQLVENWEDLNLMFTPYFLSLREEEAMPNRFGIDAIFSCFNTYNTILKHKNMKHRHVHIDVNTLKAMCKISSSVNALLLDIRKDNMEVHNLGDPIRQEPRRYLRRIEERNGTQYITMMTECEFQTWIVLGDTIVDTAKTLLSFAEKENEKEILEDIITSEVVKENIGILII